MAEQFDKMAYLQEYAKQDKRLENPKVKAELIANNDGINFERLMKMGKGSREIHVIEVFGEAVPMRVLTQKEQRLCKHNTFIYMKQYPEFVPGTMAYASEWDLAYFRKTISLSTSPCPEYTEDRYYTEDDLDSLPPVTFAYLITMYERLEDKYNPDISSIPEEEIQNLIKELQDPAKKSQLLTGMTLNQYARVTIRLLEMLTGQKDNIVLSSLLEDSNLTKVTELS